MHRNLAALPLLLLPLAGCGDPSASAPSASAPPSIAAPAAVPDPAAPSASTAVAAPTAADRDAYLDGLRGIDPGLVVNADRAIRRGRDICLDIAQGKDERTVVGNAVQRLSGGNATVDETRAVRVVALARKHICPAP